MIWKASLLLSLVLCVYSDRHQHHAILEQNSKLNDNHRGDLSQINHQRPEHHDAYAWAYPSYEFSYNVDNTHDKKSQHEVRDGDEVTGNYWLIQPDGKRRHMRYHVDDESGFTAVINYTSPHSNVYYNVMKHREETSDKKAGKYEETIKGGQLVPRRYQNDERSHNKQWGHGHEESFDKKGGRNDNLDHSEGYRGVLTTTPTYNRQEGRNGGRDSSHGSNRLQDGRRDGRPDAQKKDERYGRNDNQRDERRDGGLDGQRGSKRDGAYDSQRYGGSDGQRYRGRDDRFDGQKNGRQDFGHDGQQDHDHESRKSDESEERRSRGGPYSRKGIEHDSRRNGQRYSEHNGEKDGRLDGYRDEKRDNRRDGIPDDRRDRAQDDGHDGHRDSKHDGGIVGGSDGRREGGRDSRRYDRPGSRKNVAHDGGRDDRKVVESDGHRDEGRDGGRTGQRDGRLNNLKDGILGSGLDGRYSEHDGRKEGRSDGRTDERQGDKGGNAQRYGRRDDQRGGRHDSGHDSSPESRHDGKRDYELAAVVESGANGHQKDSNHDVYRGGNDFQEGGQKGDRYRGQSGDRRSESEGRHDEVHDWTITHDHPERYEKPVWEWNEDNNPSWHGVHAWNEGQGQLQGRGDRHGEERQRHGLLLHSVKYTPMPYRQRY